MQTINQGPIHVHVVNILGFAGHKVFTITTQLCCYSVQAIIGNTYISKHGGVLTKFYLQRKVVDLICPIGHSLLTSLSTVWNSECTFPH